MSTQSRKSSLRGNLSLCQAYAYTSKPNVAAGGARQPQGHWAPCRCTAALQQLYFVPLLRPQNYIVILQQNSSLYHEYTLLIPGIVLYITLELVYQRSTLIGHAGSLLVDGHRSWTNPSIVSSMDSSTDTHGRRHNMGIVHGQTHGVVHGRLHGHPSYVAIGHGRPWVRP